MESSRTQLEVLGLEGQVLGLGFLALKLLLLLNADFFNEIHLLLCMKNRHFDKSVNSLDVSAPEQELSEINGQVLRAIKLVPLFCSLDYDEIEFLFGWQTIYSVKQKARTRNWIIRITRVVRQAELFGPKVDKNFGLEICFLSYVHKNINQNNLATLLNFSDST